MKGGGVNRKKVGLDICVLHRSWVLWSVDLFVKYSLYRLNLYSLFDVPKYFIFPTVFHPPQFMTHFKSLDERGCPVGDETFDICRQKDIESCGLCFQHETIQIYTYYYFFFGGGLEGYGGGLTFHTCRTFNTCLWYILFLWLRNSIL